MRHVLFSCLVLLLVLAFCLFSMFHIRAICQQALTLLSDAQESAQRSDFASCRRSVDAAMRHWTRYERYFGLTLTHEQIDDSIDRFAALRQYAALGDRDDFLAGCAELRSTLEHLRQMELPTYENIL